MLKSLSLLALLAFTPSAQAAAERLQMDARDSQIFANVMRSASGIEAVDYINVKCNYSNATLPGTWPVGCVYHHRDGSKDSFSWWKMRSPTIAGLLRKYGVLEMGADNIPMLAIYNVLCDANGCTFE